jgi:hypothetical protein
MIMAAKKVKKVAPQLVDVRVFCTVAQVATARFKVPAGADVKAFVRDLNDEMLGSNGDPAWESFSGWETVAESQGDERVVEIRDHKTGKLIYGEY